MDKTYFFLLKCKLENLIKMVDIQYIVISIRKSYCFLCILSLVKLSSFMKYLVVLELFIIKVKTLYEEG